MPVKCPSRNLMFGTRNELDWHVREETYVQATARLGTTLRPQVDSAP